MKSVTGWPACRNCGHNQWQHFDGNCHWSCTCERFAPYPTQLELFE